METALRLPESPFHPSLTSSPLNQRWPPRRLLQEISSTSSTSNIELITNALVDYIKITFQKSLRGRTQTGRFSRGHTRTAPRTREGIHRLSGRKSETNQLPQPGGECHSDVLGHSRGGGQPGKSESHKPSGNSFNVTSSGPLSTIKGIIRSHRCPHLCSRL